ncbi:hypothetical protein NA57DRAFT_60424 [Rhizodiscina lignyota]|uniref:Uncharacterized protein n=1 Tax=Rhizodiscina lignyota TaxID=1504668 RepID=A0A9P4M4K5_9PEZI|nr:hypothetical protein NA57DRAFT_60424 [Rhizodiscina lignyota]
MPTRSRGTRAAEHAEKTMNRSRSDSDGGLPYWRLLGVDALKRRSGDLTGGCWLSPPPPVKVLRHQWNPVQDQPLGTLLEDRVWRVPTSKPPMYSPRQLIISAESLGLVHSSPDETMLSPKAPLQLRHEGTREAWNEERLKRHGTGCSSSPQVPRERKTTAPGASTRSSRDVSAERHRCEQFTLLSLLQQVAVDRRGALPEFLASSLLQQFAGTNLSDDEAVAGPRQRPNPKSFLTSAPRLAMRSRV